MAEPEPEPEPEVQEAHAPTVLDLPPECLRRILTHDYRGEQLLVHVATCALVHPVWWLELQGRGVRGPRHHVRCAPAYGGDIFPRAKLGHLTRVIGSPQLALANMEIGDDGALAVRAAVEAWPAPGRQYTDVYLQNSELTAVGMEALATIMLPMARLSSITVAHNPRLGDSGCAALARGLPRLLHRLSLNHTGCGDAGCAALAAALHGLPNLCILDMHSNRVGPEGCRALATALPKPGALAQLVLRENRMGDAALSLAEVLPRTELRELDVRNNAIPPDAAQVLAAAASKPRAPLPGRLRLLLGDGAAPIDRRDGVHVHCNGNWWGPGKGGGFVLMPAPGVSPARPGPAAADAI